MAARVTKWWTLSASCAGIFMLLLDITIINVALPSINRSFHTPFSDLEWVVSAYSLTLAAFLLMSGSLSDRFGRRKLFLIGLVWFTVFSVLCGISDNPVLLIGSRAGQGVGGAIMWSTSLALIADAFRGKDRATAFAIYGATSGFATAVGPVIGGVLTSDLSWRWIFFVNVPIGVLAFIVTMYGVAESRDRKASRPDFAGFLTFGLALASLVYGLILSGDDGWHSSLVRVALITSLVLLSLFVLVERNVSVPMLDLHLLRVPTFDGGLFAALVASTGLTSLIIYVTLFLQQALGLSAISTGLRLLPFTCSTLVSAAIAGRLTSQVPRKLLIAPGFVTVGTGLVLMLGLSATSSWIHLLPGMIVAGVGSGFVNVPLASTAVGVVSPAKAGMASGINATVRQAGIAAGVAALGTIFASNLVGRFSSALGVQRASVVAAALVRESPKTLAHAFPHSTSAAVLHAQKVAFAGALNSLVLVAAVITFVGAVVSLILVRERDFVSLTHVNIEHFEAPLANDHDTGLTWGEIAPD